MPSEELLEKVSHLPTTPGVYLWRDQYNRIIYVGKAINLRNRVRSYVRNDANSRTKGYGHDETSRRCGSLQTKIGDGSAHLGEYTYQGA